jgi:hypothetical protein
LSIWNDLGFTDNPYSPRPISGDEVGASLLVGRDSELSRLMSYITSSDTHPTLEGANGVGKTSLVSVAGYKLFRSWETSGSQQAIIPLKEPFQLTSEMQVSEFKKSVLYRVAQAFCENHKCLKDRGFNVPNVDAVESWLNSPLLGGVSGGVSVGGVVGASAGKTKLANTSEGFTEAGFVSTISKWLRECFPTNSSGGFLCVIDNLELLETSKSARALLEAARDEVLGIKGLRWVLCGARGIMRSAASSPRLQGVLADPQMINPIASESVQSLIEARIRAFSINEKSVAPVEAAGFGHLFEVGNKNLRNAMKYSEDFSIWATHHELANNSPAEKFSLLETWMAETASQYLADASIVGKRAWKVFDRLVEAGGSTSPSEFADFGFESNPAMRPHLRSLEETNLIESAIDETDSRRRTISITSAGWIVNYGRSGFAAIGAT